MRKKVNAFAGANNARSCSDCLALTELARLGELKCLHGKSWQKGDPTRRVTLLGEPTLCFSWTVCRVLWGNVWKIDSSRGSSGRQVTLLTGTNFLLINRSYMPCTKVQLKMFHLNGHTCYTQKLEQYSTSARERTTQAYPITAFWQSGVSRRDRTSADSLSSFYVPRRLERLFTIAWRLTWFYIDYFEDGLLKLSQVLTERKISEYKLKTLISVFCSFSSQLLLWGCAGCASEN